MARFGYFLSGEEHAPGELVQQARLAERAGFEALWISDHFHPWLDEQGQSSFAWAVIGALSQATSLPIGTAVTCPLVRTHPAIVAQAAATCAVLTGGRFTLGVGTGEFLNEHIIDSRWPPAAERMEMLEEAVALMRRLFTGKLVTHRGEHYRLDTARLYTVPDEPPPIHISGFGTKAATLAGRIADGYICMMPDADLVKVFREAGGAGRQAEGVLGVRRGAGAADRAAAVGQRPPAGRGEPAAAAAAAVPPAGAAGDRGRVRHADRARAGRLLRLLLPRGAVAPTRMTPYSHGETPGWKE
nr:TIGR03557 family F420-dependent LLM class oxidoreductase [Actinomadura nitritigenes]